MKLDYNYLKKILVTMEEYPEHQIPFYDLIKKLSGRENAEVDDKTIGHIKILYDNKCFDTLKPGCLGISYGANGHLLLNDTLYRLTAKGYEFLDLLRNDNVFNKIKDFSISTALEIGKSLIIKTMIG